MPNKNKKFRKKYVLKLNPLMPREYNAKRREELRKFEQSILNSKSNKEDIGKEPGE